ncbi:MAG: sugar transferase [Oscillospiraceae bacterium]|nr:sugar transferase [Oscillospiraceae bacterium]MBQ8978440.1 sugar transferase [Oscillospiraceae bacterium]
MKHNTRKLIMHSMYLLLTALYSGIYMFVWEKYYNKVLASDRITTDHIGWKGNLLILFVYLVLILLFSRTYNSFRIGSQSKASVIYSQGLSVLFTNGVTYIQIALLQRSVPTPVPLLCAAGVQIICAVIWTFAANALHEKLFPARRMAMIYGSRQAVSVVKKMARHDDRFLVCKAVNVSEGTDAVLEAVREYDAVIICDVPGQMKNDIIKACYDSHKRVYIVPKITDIIIRGGEEMHLLDTPLVVCKNDDLPLEALFVKRICDVLMSAVALVIASPFMLITAVCVKAYDKGPVFYTQERLTKDGRVFRLYKFRSMIVDAEQSGATLAAENDSRITPVGRVIRRLRIDELPQLINIIKGDMSIVGPRPERPELAEKNEKIMPEFSYRLRVKAGLTGYAQVMGKYNTTPYDKLRLDLIYIENYSLLLDLKLILMTVKILFIPESTEGVKEEPDQ